MDLTKLKEPFDPKLISWRVGATTKDKTKAIALAYIDARDVMERLDAVCGAENWQARYPFKGCCEIGIKIKDEWVWKSNGAGETQVEADKGQYSDAFKRAAVLWGIGQYLYDVQDVWVEIEPYGRSYKIKNPEDSKLTGALQKAAAGIRLPAEPDPSEHDRIKTWVEKAIPAMEKTDSVDALNKWHASNQAAINTLQNYAEEKKEFETAYAEHLNRIMDNKAMAAE